MIRAEWLRWRLAWHETSVAKHREQMFRSRRRANSVGAQLDRIDPPKPLPTIDAAELFAHLRSKKGDPE